MPEFNRILITGAAGSLGGHLRRGLVHLADRLRLVDASSIHAVGFHAVDDVPDTRVAHRPDTFYGLTKTFVEDLASLYWDKFGIETVALRICSCFEEPQDRRMLWSWLSF